MQLLLELLQKSKKVEKDSFSKINLLIRNNYIGIYTVCLPLSFLESKNISFKGLPINSLFNIGSIRLLEIEILLNYEVNTGNPIVAVVMRAPAKIKKGRKG